MDLTGLYLSAEELISGIPTGTEGGRIKAITIYNAAGYLLDDAVGAWYKRMSAADRFQVETEERIPWEKMLFLLTRVPWIVPVYSTEGIEMTIRRKMYLYYSPTHVVLSREDWSPEAIRKGWRRGTPNQNSKLAGFVLSDEGIMLDEPILDFLSPITMRDTYGNARSSILEMGATHTRNLPYAGIIRSPNIPLCGIGMNRLSSDWTINMQGSTLRPSPIRSWIGRTGPVRLYSIKEYNPVVFARWRNATEAQQIVESLFYQVATLPSWLYLHESLNMRSDPLPRSFPIVPLREPILRPSKKTDVTTVTKNRATNSLNMIISLLLHSLSKALAPKGGPVVSMMRRFLSNKSVMDRTLSDLSSVKSSGRYDPRRVRMLRMLSDAISIFISLDDRKKSLTKLKSELTYRDHFYWDKETGIRMFCEHEVATLENLSKGVVDADAIVDKYSIQARISGDNDLLNETPNVLECKYCHSDLGTIWLVNSSDPGVGPFVQGTFLDTEIGSFIIKLLSTQSLQTHAQPSSITRIVNTISSIAMGAEFRKLAKGNVREKNARETFLSIACTVTVLNVLMQNGAPIHLNNIALEAMLSKEYIDTLQKIGLLPKAAVLFMLDYWPKTLSRYFANAKDLIRNSVIELTGIEEDKLLASFYRSAIAYPVTCGRKTIDLSSIDPAAISKLAQPVRLYVAIVTRSTPIEKEKRKSFRPHPLVTTDRDPRLYIPRSVTPIVRSASIGKVESEDVREAFTETIVNICPELLLHPISGKDFYSSDVLIYAPQKVHLEAHSFRGAKSCSRCSIESNLVVGDTYYTKYRRVVEDLEKATPKYSTSCGQVGNRKGRDVSAVATPLKIDTSLDRDSAKEFNKRFGWGVGPVTSIISELIHIVSAIGHYRLGELIEATKEKERSNLITTAWNIFMQWTLKQKEDVATRTMFRLRSIHATSISERGN